MKSISSYAKRGFVMGLLGLALHQAVWAQTDPPARVGRLDLSEGQTSIANPSTGEWMSVNPNQPLLGGDTLFIHPGARAEMHLGSHALRISGNSSVQLLQLDDQAAKLQLNQGSLILRVRQLYSDERVELITANLKLQILQPGEYKISYYDNLSTTVAVRQGSAIASAEGNSVTLYQGQQSNFFDTDLKHSRISGLGYLDEFDRWAMARDQAEENSISARYLPRDMPGYQQLDNYGEWENHSEYGPVWYPQRVVDDWAPYRDGKWVWIAPWGWTWVDAAPWGFAPFHYGRWVYASTLSGRRWCWVPGRYPVQIRPVYAPALVAFIGSSSNVVLKGGYSPNYVSWFPLGPGEVYRPGYHHSQHYWHNLNHGGWSGRNQGIPERRPVAISYVNQYVPRAVTTIDQHNFVRGDSVFNMTRIIKNVPLNSNQNLNHSVQLQPDNKNRYGVNYNAEIARDRQSASINRVPLNLPQPQANSPAVNLNEARPRAESRYESRLQSNAPANWSETTRGSEVRRDAAPLAPNPTRNQPYQAPQPVSPAAVAPQAPVTNYNQPVYTAPRSLPAPNERMESRAGSQSAPQINPPAINLNAPANAPGWVRQAVPESQREAARPEYRATPNANQEYRRDAAVPSRVEPRPEPRYEAPRVESPRVEARPESRSLNVPEVRREPSRIENRIESRPEVRAAEPRREASPAAPRSEAPKNERNESRSPRSEKEGEHRR